MNDTGDLAVSVIHLERAGMPRLVILSLLVTIILIGALGYVLCRYDLKNFMRLDRFC